MRWPFAVPLGCFPGCVLACLILSPACLAQPNWIQIKPKNSPPARYWHANAHDFVRGRTIVFSGSTAASNYASDIWEYDGSNWTKMSPKNSPSGRWLASMSYHFARVRTVMFGGRTSTGTYPTDTWTWDGKDWTQVKTTNAPPGRWGPGMAYDSGRQRTVLFGGQSPGGQLNDTWEFDGANWTKITTQNSPPPGRARGLAYDSARRRVVLFGGQTPTVTGTWEYDGKNWTKMNPTTEPSNRSALGMAYDIARSRTVIFGGTPTQQETWEYDGKTWTLVKTATSPPTRYDYDLMVYDQRRKRMVLFGGYSGGARLGDTWEYVASQSLTGNPSTVSIATGGTQTFSLNAGTANGSRLYWVLGSVTGTSPGVTLASPAGSVNIPLNPDFWTDITIGFANSAILTKTRGALDAAGKGSATLNVPKITNQSAIGVKFYHAYLVYDAQNNFYMASNPVELTLVR